MRLSAMKEEDRIGVRVSVELKKALIQIAKTEDRSLAQVCEIFLKDGTLSYKKLGRNFFNDYSRAINERSGSSIWTAHTRGSVSQVAI